MPSSLTKKLILSAIALGSGGGILKWVIDSSSPAPDLLSTFSQMSDASVPPPSEQTKKELSNTEIVKSVLEEVTPRSLGFEGVLQEDSEERKRRLAEESKMVYSTLDDYTFKLFGPCRYGTAWILDYQLPKNPKEYPTTWYIVTNAHVISDFRFSSNPYNQLMPFDVESVKKQRETKDGRYWIEMHKKHPLDNITGKSCESPKKYGFFDFNIAQNQEGVNRVRKANFGAVGLGQMEEPKLFFGAFNFMDKEKTGVDYDHYSDFAILELTFKTETEAERATGGFARKYTVDSTNAIDIFYDPLESRYSKEGLNYWDENIYLLAYPDGERATNFNKEDSVAARLGGRREPNNKNYKGFVSARSVSKGTGFENFWWGQHRFQDFGHRYVFRHNPLGKGASGGLFVDKNLGALALTSVISKSAQTSWVVPLRSSGVEFQQKGQTVKIPKFDLILGAEGQLSSYRQQVVEHIIKKQNKETWLSKRGWKHVSERDALSVWF